MPKPSSSSRSETNDKNTVVKDARPQKSHLQKSIEKLGLLRDIDRALHLPYRYEDETRLTKLRDAREGDTVQIEAVVTQCDVTYRPRRQLLVTVDDGSDTCTLRFFSFFPSQQKALAVGNAIRVRGEVKGGFMGHVMGFTMMHPSFKAAGGELATALTPVYATVAGLPQAYLRKVVLHGLSKADLSETLPEEMFSLQNIGKIGLKPAYSLSKALSFLHHPTPDVMLQTLEDRTHPAWQRLKLEELLAQQLSQTQAKRERALLRAPVLKSAAANPLHQRLLQAIPFKLTAAQQRVCAEIDHDLTQAKPMHRLLQGDVGSGKTVVAALAATRCMDAGWQCALMAPTEILAEQHFRKLISWLEPLGITIAWLTGSQKAKERREALALIASGEAQLVIGTHAVIQAKVQFKNLALAIIDEQHRFGVAQRLALRNKTNYVEHLELVEGHHGSGSASPQGVAPLRGDEATRSEQATGRCKLEPHLLMMTATPIPRTLAMSYYADLDVSTIDELPPGRTPIMTKVVSDTRRDDVIQRIRTQLLQGRQVYWVCPLIEESEALDLSNATETHAQLCVALGDLQVKNASGQIQSVMVGLLHSRMPVAEKKAVMALFTSGQMQVLVSTTVIEVGVDVPNASLMVIEHAERFGLSQLHQLRGRVGRGAAASVCVLLYSTGDAPRLGETARERLKAMAETNDGFEIAKRDLQIRGPGEFLGAKQSGDALLRFADLATDTELLNQARQLAPVMLTHHPLLAQKHIERWLGSKTNYLNA
ncbi:MAG TPA: ATP-dependent DNA helicase RecG [Burkholderiaceae bacterium]|nr:ATP-dependent DNA helicase RecG [Burkholderiaceae bacterium]